MFFRYDKSRLQERSGHLRDTATIPFRLLGADSGGPRDCNGTEFTDIQADPHRHSRRRRRRDRYFGRIVGEWLDKRTGLPVVIENRTGAGGNIALEQVAKGEPDGHTLLVATNGAITINPRFV